MEVHEKRFGNAFVVSGAIRVVNVVIYQVELTDGTHYLEKKT